MKTEHQVNEVNLLSSDNFQEDWQKIGIILHIFILHRNPFQQSKYTKKKHKLSPEQIQEHLINTWSRKNPRKKKLELKNKNYEVHFLKVWRENLSQHRSDLIESRKLMKIADYYLNQICIVGISDYEIAKYLSEFNLDRLKTSEIKIKQLIKKVPYLEEIQSKSVLDFLSILISIAIVAFLVQSSANFLPKNSFAEILIIVGGVLSLKKLMDIVMTYLLPSSYPSIQITYERCLSLIETAKIISEQSTKEHLNSLSENSKTDQNLMQSLRHHIIDQPSDFDHNS